MHVMILLSCGYLPQYKIPEVEKHKIMTRNCVVILKIKKIEKIISEIYISKHRTVFQVYAL